MTILNNVASWLLTNNGELREEIKKFGDYFFCFCDEPDFDNIPEEVKGHKIIYVDSCEPDFMCSGSRSVINNSQNYHLILTRRKEILNECTNSVFMPWGTTWIENWSGDIEDKSNSISFTTTAKQNPEADGYDLRFEVVNNLTRTIREASSIPFFYYNSSRSPLMPYLSDGEIREKKDPLFKHRYHLAMENQRCDGYFSEKLIDCFQTKTVPVYFGCPNIHEFFDVRGMIIVENYEGLLKVLKEMKDFSESSYEEMREHIEFNYEESKKYAKDFVVRMVDTIEKSESMFEN